MTSYRKNMDVLYGDEWVKIKSVDLAPGGPILTLATKSGDVTVGEGEVKALNPLDQLAKLKTAMYNLYSKAKEKRVTVVEVQAAYNALDRWYRFVHPRLPNDGSANRVFDALDDAMDGLKISINLMSNDPVYQPEGALRAVAMSVQTAIDRGGKLFFAMGDGRRLENLSGRLPKSKANKSDWRTSIDSLQSSVGLALANANDAKSPLNASQWARFTSQCKFILDSISKRPDTEQVRSFLAQAERSLAKVARIAGVAPPQSKEPKTIGYEALSALERANKQAHEGDPLSYTAPKPDVGEIHQKLQAAVDTIESGGSVSVAHLDYLANMCWRAGRKQAGDFISKAIQLTSQARKYPEAFERQKQYLRRAVTALGGVGKSVKAAISASALQTLRKIAAAGRADLGDLGFLRREPSGVQMQLTPRGDKILTELISAELVRFTALVGSDGRHRTVGLTDAGRTVLQGKSTAAEALDDTLDDIRRYDPNAARQPEIADIQETVNKMGKSVKRGKKRNG